MTQLSLGLVKAERQWQEPMAGRQKVTLIEKSDRMYGGTCINVGCIPTKSLVYGAGLAAAKEFL